MPGNTCIVTGGEGFIGQAVQRVLVEEGITPISFDTSLGWDVMTDKPPQAFGIIHLAGILGTSELFSDPFKAVDINIKGTLNMLEWCKGNKATFVGITMPQVWKNVYQATKGCAMDLAIAYGKQFDFPVTHVCAYNAYGPGQKVHGVQKIIPTFAYRSWRGRPMPIWGDGSQKVDLVHVDDVAKTLVTALKNPFLKFREAGSGDAMTVLEIADMVGNITGNHDKKFMPMRPGETDSQGVVAIGPVFTPSARHDPRFEETVNWYRADRP